MKIYKVGGAVRDTLLGRAVSDRDWVVVGAAPQDLLAAGYTPVGGDFPVFLHPKTREEYALARTERKNGVGYHGFRFHAAPDVTLEQDLSRRDLTINAMAQDDSGRVIDPYGGQRDLAAKLLRHVSPAFAEDPVRILRLARFSARFADFRVADETTELMRQMVLAGEVDTLVAERVWQELSRGLMESTPSRMFEVLRGCGALARVLPEVDRLWGIPQRADYHPEIDTGVHLMMVFDVAADFGANLAVRFACLGHDLGKAQTPAEILPRHMGHEQRSVRLVRQMSARLRVPTECRELATLVAGEHGNVHGSGDFDASALLRLLERCDALRRPQRLGDILLACECDSRGRLGRRDSAYPQADRLRLAQATALQVNTENIAQAAAERGLRGPAIGALIRSARADAIRAMLRVS